MEDLVPGHPRSGVADTHHDAAGIVRRLVWRIKSGDRSAVADNAGLLTTAKDSTFQNKVHLTMQAKGFFEKGDGDASGGN